MVGTDTQNQNSTAFLLADEVFLDEDAEVANFTCDEEVFESPVCRKMQTQFEAKARGAKLVRYTLVLGPDEAERYYAVVPPLLEIPQGTWSADEFRRLMDRLISERVEFVEGEDGWEEIDRGEETLSLVLHKLVQSP